jgi:tetratricopeptide (TPR) repeat protein
MRHFSLLILLILSLSATVAYGQAAPSSAEDYFNRGTARYGKGDLDGAIADFTKAIELNPQDAAAYFNRGSVRDEKGDHDGAITDYNKAIEFNPQVAVSYANRGMAKLEQGKDAEAQQDFDTAIKLDGSLKSEVEAMRAEIKQARKPKE